MKTEYDVIVVGGGAAGFFTALNIKQYMPNTEVLILERTKEVLSKVRVSGGGRCNVTHAEFIPSELINNYPRGKKIDFILDKIKRNTLKKETLAGCVIKKVNQTVIITKED